jgi:hypothetical protein
LETTTNKQTNMNAKQTIKYDHALLILSLGSRQFP